MTLIQSDAATVAEVLRATRAVARLSTRDIAPMVGVSRNTVSNWERGISEPSVTQFLLWARATKQPAERLLGGLSIEDVRPKGLEPLTF